MAPTRPAAETNDRRELLSTLWIVVLFNYLYVDLLSTILNPAAMRNIATGMPPAVLLGWAIVLEIAIAMIFLSKVLNYRANRWANTIAGVLETAGAAFTLSGGLPAVYFLPAIAVEIGCTVFIAWYAWSWRPQHAPAAAAV